MTFRQYTADECTGRDGYPPEWHATIKHAVREQAGHRCIRCLHPYLRGAGKWSLVTEAAWRILTVHHLDGDKGNCRWWNLVSLCQRCHLEIQCKVDMQRRWLKPHSTWFQPYVAAYYAWTFLSEDLTREQTMTRLDDLLDLEERQLELDVAA